jgi:MFS family permease
MMGLIYGVMGSWWPMLAVHLEDLGVTERGRGWIFATMAVGAIVTPLGAGQLADRLMPTQRLLALIYAIGTGLLGAIALGTSSRFAVLFPLFLIYWLLTAPTYGLAASLALRNLPRPGEQFGGVRLWGTVGWMAVGWVVSLVMWLHGRGHAAGGGAFDAFWVAAGFSALFAAFCLTLPDTPPLATASRGAINLTATAELIRRPAVAVFLVVAFGSSLTQPFVYQVVPTYLQQAGLPRAWLALAMTLSQVLEILSLAVLPILLRRFGYRGTMLIGVGAWVVYHGNFALAPPLLVALVGMPISGVAIGCLVIAGQMYLDNQARPDQRASAQALQVMVTTGTGSFLGNLLAGELMAWNGGVGGPVFAVPCLIDLAMLGVLVAWFRPSLRGERATRPAVRLEGAVPVALAGGKLAPGRADT